MDRKVRCLRKEAAKAHEVERSQISWTQQGRLISVMLTESGPHAHGLTMDMWNPLRGQAEVFLITFTHMCICTYAPVCWLLIISCRHALGQTAASSAGLHVSIAPDMLEEHHSSREKAFYHNVWPDWWSLWNAGVHQLYKFTFVSIMYLFTFSLRSLLQFHFTLL